MRHKSILFAALFTALLGISLTAYGVEKSQFVTKCMINGRHYKPCACTYDALPELPDAYADLAVSWAHEPPADYRMAYIKTLAMQLVPTGGGRKTGYAIRRTATSTSYFGGLIKSLGTSYALKWVVSLLPGVDGGTSYVVTSATRATGKFGYARYIFDKHCSKRLQTMASEFGRFSSAVADTTTNTVAKVGRRLSQAAGNVTETTTTATRSAARLFGMSMDPGDP